MTIPRPGAAFAALCALALPAWGAAEPQTAADEPFVPEEAASHDPPDAEDAPTPALPLCGGDAADDGRCTIPSFTTIVTGKRPPPPGSHARIDAREIELRGARNVAEAVAGEPSIEVNQGPKTGATLQVRGFDERAVLLMIEGIPIREVYDGHFDLASLPAFSLGAIDIERGVTTLLHGPNTAGAILALRAPTTCGETLDLSGQVRPERPGRLLYGGRLKACQRLGELSLFASAGYERSNGHVLSRDYVETASNAQFHERGGRRDGSDYTRGTAAVLARYAPRTNKSLSLFVNGVHAPRGIPPFEGFGYTRYWRFARYDTLLTGLAGVLGPAPEDQPQTWGFRLVRGQLYAHLHRDELRDYEDVRYERLTTNPLAWFVASAYANETVGAAVQGSWALNTGNRLELALRYTLDRHAQRERPVPRDGVTSAWTRWERYAAHTLTAAVEDTQVVGPWRLNAGVGLSGVSLVDQELRGTDYPVDRRLIPAAEGRVVLERSLGDRVRLMTAGGHKVRLPMLKELFANSIGGNTELRAERAWMSEAGVDTHGLGLPALDSSLRLFWNAIADLIERYRDRYDNIGRAITAGVEAELRLAPVEQLQLYAGYRYLHARDLERDRALDYRTPHRVLAGARAATRFGLTAAVGLTVSSGQEAYYVDALTGDWVAERLGGFALVDAHLRYLVTALAPVEVYLYADAFNLLDTSYVVGSFEPRPGREVIVGLGGRY